MFKFVVAILSGASIAGSVYMAGWGSMKNCHPASEEACCETPHSAMEMSAPSAEGKVDAGNTKCAVMGDDIAGSKVTVEYKGTVYHMCCKDCVATFNKEPEKYVAQIKADPAKYGIKASH